jgi:hypothetical protein
MRGPDDTRQLRDVVLKAAAWTSPSIQNQIQHNHPSTRPYPCGPGPVGRQPDQCHGQAGAEVPECHRPAHHGDEWRGDPRQGLVIPSAARTGS